ncbi:MAG: RNA methyltransferase [Flavobacteriales bacterium]
MNKKTLNSELDRLSIEEFKSQKKTPIIVILDNIRSLNNIGSVFRTSDAFRIEKIYLCGYTATPPNKDIAKTALGATKSVDWEHREDIIELIQELRKNTTEVYAIEQTSDSIMLDNFQPKKNAKTAVIFGNEVQGVQQEAIDVCNGVIEIPQIGTKHSLNISVSNGVVLWDLFSKLK